MGADLRIDLFGTMRVLVGGEPLPKVRSRKAKWLLALLALRGGKPIARSIVAGMLWPDTEATVALTNLRSVVNDLRQALGAQTDRLEAPDRKTLRFDIKGVKIDVLAFDTAIRAGEFEGAVALYAGPLLQDCDEEWAAPERSARQRACLAALRELGQRSVPEAAIAFFQKAIETAPWQDAPRRDLMNAFAGAGDLNAALAVYREYAQALRAENGGAPDLQTTELYVRLRSGESKAPSPTPRAGTMPSSITSFVGREDEQVELAKGLQTHRLVTLSGLGGVGKTRLAREVARVAPFPDGAWFVSLEAVHEESGVLRAVMATLRLSEHEGPRRERLAEHLRAKRLLLVLDNCEHLVGVCARLSDRLLGECPGLRILATSREPLGLVGEKVWPVPGLTVPDSRHLPAHPATLVRVLAGYESVRLFVERANAASNFELTRDNAVAVAELCELLEGLPLALELAASRTRALDLADIATRLGEHRLDLLVGNRHVGAPRHQTLRAALDWSYSLLGSDERRLFGRLAVFSGGWSLYAAEAVAGAEPILLEALVEKSLVTFMAGRYGYLETVREYAKERLNASGEREAIEDAHREWAVATAERLRNESASPEAVEPEMANFRAALDSADANPEASLRIVSALGTYWDRLYAGDEGIRRLEAVLEASKHAAASSARARAAMALGSLVFRSDNVAATARYGAALADYRALGDGAGAVNALRGLGLAAYFRGEFGVAEVQWEECLEAARKEADPVPIALALASLSMVCFPKGDYRRAMSLALDSLAVFRRSNQPNHIAEMLRTVSSLAHDLGDYDAMRAANEEAIGLFREIRRDEGVASCLDDLGKAATDLGQYERAREMLESALALHQKIANQMGVASTLVSLGHLAIARGDAEAAVAHGRESLELFQSLEHRLGIARAWDALGDASAALGRGGEARLHHRQGLATWREVGDRKRIRDSLIRLGDGEETPSVAMRLWGQAEKIGEEMGLPIPALLRPRYEARRKASQDDLEAWEAGRAMSLESALEIALGM